jgi:hypothetical protein
VNTVKVDAVSHLPNGPTVNGLRELKAYILRERADDVAMNVLRRLMTYGLGRPLTLRDRFAMAELLAGAKAKGLGLRDMIVAICQSELFTAPTSSKLASTSKPL